MTRPSPRHSDEPNDPTDDRTVGEAYIDVANDPDTSSMSSFIPGELLSFDPAPVQTKGVKATYAAALSFVAIFLGAITTARAGGADFDVDLFLVALYASITGSGITGGVVYAKPNPEK